MSEDTKDKIIRAAIDLVDEKGYKGATTRMIAEVAGVNEVTLFRQFGSKQGVLEAAIEKYSFFDEIDDVMNKQIQWNLDADLQMLSKAYQNIVGAKRGIILISLREEGRFPELDQAISKLPTSYRDTLVDYFKVMINRGKMAPIDARVAATHFIMINFGYFFLKERLSDGSAAISLDDFIENHITMFINSLR